MAPPILSPEDLQTQFPGIDAIGAPFPNSGQKQVFPCTKNGAPFVLKVMEPGPPEEGSPTIATIRSDSVFKRAEREVRILSESQSPHLPKLGPVELQIIYIQGQPFIVFSEERIPGRNLAETIKRDGCITVPDLYMLAHGISAAISEFSQRRRIHRDIKPNNIMRRQTNEYVLLDPGIAFELDGDSLTAAGITPHTPGYIAPELVPLGGKRGADHRSDMFLLGIVLYEAATGRHPFKEQADRDPSVVIDRILKHTPQQPVQLRAELPLHLNALILRLLSKQPHARFRTCDHLLRSLDEK